MTRNVDRNIDRNVDRDVDPNIDPKIDRRRAQGDTTCATLTEKVRDLVARFCEGGVMRALIALLLLAPFMISTASAAPTKTKAPGVDSAMIEALTGAKGKMDEKEGVFKVSVPRTDLSVTAAGVRLTPPMGLTSWASFTRTGKHAMVMGDMTLLEDQVNPVMSAAFAQGLDVTALHNHFFWETPRVMFMHISGMGDEATLARAVGQVFAKIKETSGGKGEVPAASIDPAKTTLDPAKIESILGVTGELKDGVYKVAIGRTTKMSGHPMQNAMGVNTWAAFAGADDQAVVDGDFAMLESELQAVLRALRNGGINVVAIHQHMSGEEPRILFLHYWGVGKIEGLATSLRAALDKTNHR